MSTGLSTGPSTGPLTFFRMVEALLCVFIFLSLLTVDWLTNRVKPLYDRELTCQQECQQTPKIVNWLPSEWEIIVILDDRESHLLVFVNGFVDIIGCTC